MNSYDEGPYQNWTAIHFPAGGLYVESVFDFGPTTRFITMKPLPIGRVSSDGAEFQGLLTGVTSGATYDCTLIPVIPGYSPDPVNPAPTITACTQILQYLYDEATGNAVTLAPDIGANIVTDSGVFILAQASFTYDGVSACLNDNNAPALPAFVAGEDVTVTN